MEIHVKMVPAMSAADLERVAQRVSDVLGGELVNQGTMMAWDSTPRFSDFTTALDDEMTEELASSYVPFALSEIDLQTSPEVHVRVVRG